MKRHRLVWEEHHGLIPAGMVVRHKCDNTRCMNIDHLELGTQLDNIQDRHVRGRDARGVRIGIAKLTPDQVLAIRKDERSNVKVAADYGVAPSTVHYVRSGFTWKHV